MHSEKYTYTDPVSGVPVTQLTDYKGHSHHFYFSNSGWYAQNTKYLFSSDRDNRTNLFSIEVGSGAITQITDLPPVARSERFDFITACCCPQRSEAYFWRAGVLTAVNLDTKALRELYTADPVWNPSMMACSADGAYLYFGLEEVVSREEHGNTKQANLGIRTRWLARPLSQIVRLPLDGGPLEVIFEENALLGHINTSPTQPHLITYCHEGPWEEVDCRIWVMDTLSGERWRIEPPHRRFHIGHEYWYADGLHVGFHGITGGQETVIGGASALPQTATAGASGNSSGVQPLHNWHAPQMTVTGHIHSLGADLVVGDGYHDGVLKLWKRIGGEVIGPKVLSRHDCSFKIQQLHAHPQMTPDGKHVLYTSDRGGYGNIYLAPLPQSDAEFLALPDWKD